MRLCGAFAVGGSLARQANKRIATASVCIDMCRNKNAFIPLFLALTLSGCSALETIDLAARGVHIAGLGIDAARSLKNTVNDPAVSNKDGRFLQFLTIKDGFFLIEISTESNADCLDLAQQIGTTSDTKFRCTDLSAESSLLAKGIGKATVIATGKTYDFRSETAPKCYSFEQSPITNGKLKLICSRD